MFKKNIFFKGFYFKSKQFNINLTKTKKNFLLLQSDLKNSQIPLLKSFEKNFSLDYSSEISSKFSKYKNLVIIGMGGSILGTQCIYSFLEKKIKKKLFFF